MQPSEIPHIHDSATPEALQAYSPSPTSVLRQGEDLITLVRPTIRADSFESQRDLAEAYSRLKLGDHNEIARGAIDVVHALPASVCHSIALQPEDWRVLSIGTYRGFGLPSAALLVARECAERLGLKHVTLELSGSDRSRVSSNRYEDLSSKAERMSILKQEIAHGMIPGLVGKNVLLCDDSLASGTFIELVSACARAQGARSVYSLVLHYFDGHGDHSFERRVNISSFSADPVRAFTDLLTNPRTTFTTRLVAYCLGLPNDDLRAVLTTVPERGRINLLAAGIVFYGDRMPEVARALFLELEPEIMKHVQSRDDSREHSKHRVGYLLHSQQWRNELLSRSALISSLLGTEESLAQN
jgi:hypothetical protein